LGFGAPDRDGGAVTSLHKDASLAELIEIERARELVLERIGERPHNARCQEPAHVTGTAVARVWMWVAVAVWLATCAAMILRGLKLARGE
jgi:hypothetical protein